MEEVFIAVSTKVVLTSSRILPVYIGATIDVFINSIFERCIELSFLTVINL